MVAYCYWCEPLLVAALVPAVASTTGPPREKTWCSLYYAIMRRSSWAGGGAARLGPGGGGARARAVWAPLPTPLAPSRVLTMMQCEPASSSNSSNGPFKQALPPGRRTRGTVSTMAQTTAGAIQNDDGGPRPGQSIIEVVLPTYIMKPEETEM